MSIWPGARAAAIFVMAIGCLSGAGCALWNDIVPPPLHGVTRIEKAGLAMEFSPFIDRVTYFGPASDGGKNALHVVDLERAVPEDGSYTFFGGCYSWVAPQKSVPAGEDVIAGWIDGARVPRDWPPDPAMDIGPVRRTGAGPDWLTSIGPEHRTGLVEGKTLRIVDRNRAMITYTVANRGNDTVAAGCWLTTAAAPDSVIAVRMPEGAQVYGWDDRSVRLFESALSARDGRGWRTLRPGDAKWEGGIKVYIAAPAGTPMDIAVWSPECRSWLHRSQPALSEEAMSRLIAMGEGPVAVYMEPSAGIFEAELYGPIETLAPGGATTVAETWAMVDARIADTSLLP